jgi:hypothetical protein
LFNLIMKGRPWEEGRDTIPASRIFEFTEDDIVAKFKRDGQPLFDELSRLPCLFMQEGTGDELARVGTVTRARIVGREILIEYTLDLDIPAVPNSAIFSRKIDFDIANDFEFSRVHWAIKDVEIYRVLLRNSRPRRQRPTVFTIPDNEKIEPSLASAMMPFNASFSPVFDTIRAAAEAVGLKCRRADDIWENVAIIEDIVSLIDRSRVVICDCTGRNPNVFYEIGIAHTLGRDVVMITQADDDIPFDLRHHRYVRYLNNGEGRLELQAALEGRLTTLLNDP